MSLRMKAELDSLSKSMMLEMAGRPDSELVARLHVIRESLTWLNTPYHHAAGVKNVGVDCAYFLIKVFEASIFINPPDNVPAYKPGLAGLREGQSMYEKIVSHYAFENKGRGPAGALKPVPADIVLFRFGHLTHGAIVVSWPHVIHAFNTEGKVVVSDATKGLLRSRWERTYTIKGWCE